jgi:hypothetical protein
MSSTIKTIETNNATTSLTKTTSNPPRIPPPGKIYSYKNLLINFII